MLLLSDTPVAGRSRGLRSGSLFHRTESAVDELAETCHHVLTVTKLRPMPVARKAQRAGGVDPRAESCLHFLSLPGAEGP